MEALTSKVSKYGRSLITNLSILVKITQIYDSLNETILNIATRLLTDISLLSDETDELVINMIEGSFYIEGVRIKPGLSDIDVFFSLAGELKKRSIGVLDFRTPMKTEDLINLAYAIKGGGEVSEIQTMLESKLTKGVTVGGTVLLQKEEGIDLKDSQTLAKRAFIRAVASVMEMDNSIKAGRRLKIKKVKRALQLMVDSILADESLLLGLTGIRNTGKYYYFHPINVAIISMAIAKKIGFDKQLLRGLALTAFFHDAGKAEIPLSILDKKNEFTQKELDLIKRHPTEGVKVFLRLFGLNESTILSMLVSYEHHMKLDLSGYPRTSPDRKQCLFSRIVSIANDYDSLISGKIYSRTKLSTTDAIKLMLEGKGTSYDPVLLKAFTGLFN
jgi:HD-GYP domain-containing protein (c-di-GMP phosphodiesterase class II)